MGGCIAAPSHLENANYRTKEMGNNSVFRYRCHVSEFIHHLFALPLTDESTAAANIGCLISTESCHSSLGFSYCDLNDSIWMTAEICGGILMACVPTLGNLFFFRKAKPSFDLAADGNKNLVTIGSAPIRSKKATTPQFPSLIYTRTEDPDDGERSMIALTENAAQIETLSRSSRYGGILREGRHA